LKYLITGANGFIGSFLKNKLISDGHLVKTLGKSSGNDFCIDLTRESLKISEDYDVIIHTASIVHNSKHANTIDSKFIFKDLEITLNLLRSIEKVTFKKLIYLSSVSVYGIDFGRDIDISQKISPRSGYGFSKAISEKIFAQNLSEEKLLILRLPLVYGPNPKGNIKKVIDTIESGKMVLFNGNTSKKTILELEDLYNFLVKRSANLYGTHQIKSYDIELNTFINGLSNKRIFFIPKVILKMLLISTKIFNLNGLRNILMKIDSDLTFIDTTNIK
jgi:GlcNAc-P-P-Und epimerase